MRNYNGLIYELRERAEFEFILEGDDPNELWRSEILKTAANAIEDLQNAVEGNVAEGEWTEWHDKSVHPLLARQFRCSICGSSNSYGMSDYCPRCGAKMKRSV